MMNIDGECIKNIIQYNWKPDEFKIVQIISKPYGHYNRRYVHNYIRINNLRYLIQYKEIEELRLYLTLEEINDWNETVRIRDYNGIIITAENDVEVFIIMFTNNNQQLTLTKEYMKDNITIKEMYLSLIESANILKFFKKEEDDYKI